MGWLDVLATVAYASWTAAVLMAVGVIVAEYRTTRDSIWLMVLATAIFQFAGSAALSLTIGSFAFLPLTLATIIVRGAWLLSAMTLWATVVHVLWRRYKGSRQGALRSG